MQRGEEEEKTIEKKEVNDNYYLKIERRHGRGKKEEHCG